MIDETAEWRNFGSDDNGKADMNRVGGTVNPYLSNGGLDTNVKGSGADQYARWLVSGKIGSSYAKGKKGDAAASASTKDKQIAVGIQFLQDLSSRLNIMEPTFKEACRIMKKAHDKDIARGMKINVKSATILFVACKLTNINKELGDITCVTSTNQRDIAKCYKKLKPVLPGAVINQTSSKYALDAAKKLKLPEDIAQLCE